MPGAVVDEREAFSTQATSSFGQKISCLPSRAGVVEVLLGPSPARLFR
jgi:hypothetical protein